MINIQIDKQELAKLYRERQEYLNKVQQIDKIIGEKLGLSDTGTTQHKRKKFSPKEFKALCG